MKPRLLLTAVAAILAHAPAARTQVTEDTALVDAVSYVAQGNYKHRLEVAPGETAFDSAVAGRLRALPAATLPPPQPGYRDWVGTQGVTFAGNTAAVVVRFGTSAPPDGSLIDTYIEDTRYLFVREGAGWRFLRCEFLRGMDLGPVRG
ncbi:hypothetical protein [Longimicrobium sp.]|uniref:hypothetical protein n=1 Tax=Longimicrobium sp. TaxID=2029185 RepID=UPI002E37EFEC|nr:hypothetical protein [Longimicrobium sp.]HEX6038330.1 hypothetical protein [Longimicrobium sp.]